MHGPTTQFGRLIPTMPEAVALRVAIVDDDPGVLDALRVLFEVEGCTVSTYPSGDQFLAFADRVPSDCLLLDVNMPGSSGMQVLNAIGGRAYLTPVIMISGLSDIPMAVAAIKAGAYDFVEKPFGGDVVERVREGVRNFRERGSTKARGPVVRSFPGLERLTSRENSVLMQITQGLTNKEVARTLSISPRTVEVHRSRIMDKVGARNTADLMRIVFGKS
jgi:two-component system, LuxR family, response regulator FixJ